MESPPPAEVLRERPADAGHQLGGADVEIRFEAESGASSVAADADGGRLSGVSAESPDSTLPHLVDESRSNAAAAASTDEGADMGDERSLAVSGDEASDFSDSEVMRSGLGLVLSQPAGARQALGGADDEEVLVDAGPRLGSDHDDQRRDAVSDDVGRDKPAAISHPSPPTSTPRSPAPLRTEGDVLLSFPTGVLDFSKLPRSDPDGCSHSPSSHALDSESSSVKPPVRPDHLNLASHSPPADTGRQPVHLDPIDLDRSSVSIASSDPDLLLDRIDDFRTPDDLETPSSLLEESVDLSEFGVHAFDDRSSTNTPTAETVAGDTGRWRTVTILSHDHRLDTRAVAPYRKALTHGGYYGERKGTLIVIAGCYLPDRRVENYSYIMEHLFLYLVDALELMVHSEYMLIYLHGGTPKHQHPPFWWLKKCYRMMDYRLRKSLKALFLVHPTVWLRTVVLLAKPFISSKFWKKIFYLKNLEQLDRHLPTDFMYIPDEVRRYDKKHHPRTDLGAATEYSV